MQAPPSELSPYTHGPGGRSVGPSRDATAATPTTVALPSVCDCLRLPAITRDSRRMELIDGLDQWTIFTLALSRGYSATEAWFRQPSVLCKATKLQFRKREPFHIAPVFYVPSGHGAPWPLGACPAAFSNTTFLSALAKDCRRDWCRR